MGNSLASSSHKPICALNPVGGKSLTIIIKMKQAICPPSKEATNRGSEKSRSTEMPPPRRHKKCARNVGEVAAPRRRKKCARNVGEVAAPRRRKKCAKNRTENCCSTTTFHFTFSNKRRREKRPTFFGRNVVIHDIISGFHKSRRPEGVSRE